MAIVTDVAREGERIEHTTLATLDSERVTMRSLVLVAGDTTRWAGEWLVAERDARARCERPAPSPAEAPS